MPPRDWRLRVRDILRAIERIESFTRGLTVSAVNYELVVIGEAARNVPAEVRAAAPGIPWHVLSDLRNVVVHAYFGVDLAVVWETATRDVPRLGPQLRALLDG